MRGGREGAEFSTTRWRSVGRTENAIASLSLPREGSSGNADEKVENWGKEWARKGEGAGVR